MSVAHAPDAAVDIMLTPRLLSFEIEYTWTFREESQENTRKLEDFNSKIAPQRRAA